MTATAYTPGKIETAYQELQDRPDLQGKVMAWLEAPLLGEEQAEAQSILSGREWAATLLIFHDVLVGGGRDVDTLLDRARAAIGADCVMAHE